MSEVQALGRQSLGGAATVGCRSSGTPLSTPLARGWGWVPRASLHGEKAPGCTFRSCPRSPTVEWAPARGLRGGSAVLKMGDAFR